MKESINQKLRGKWNSELEASLTYRASSRITRATTQRNSVSKNKTQNQPKKLVILRSICGFSQDSVGSMVPTLALKGRGAKAQQLRHPQKSGDLTDSAQASHRSTT